MMKPDFMFMERVFMDLPTNDPASPGQPGRRARGRPRGWDDKTAQNTIKSLDRAMRVFEYLSEGPGKPLT